MRLRNCPESAPALSAEDFMLFAATQSLFDYKDFSHVLWIFDLDLRLVIFGELDMSTVCHWNVAALTIWYGPPAFLEQSGQ